MKQEALARADRAASAFADHARVYTSVALVGGILLSAILFLLLPLLAEVRAPRARRTVAHQELRCGCRRRAGGPGAGRRPWSERGHVPRRARQRRRGRTTVRDHRARRGPGRRRGRGGDRAGRSPLVLAHEPPRRRRAARCAHCRSRCHVPQPLRRRQHGRRLVGPPFGEAPRLLCAYNQTANSRPRGCRASPGTA